MKPLYFMFVTKRPDRIRHSRLLLGLGILLALTMGVSGADLKPGTAGQPRAPEVHPDTLLVGFKSEIQTAARWNIHAEIGTQRAHSYGFIPVDVVRLAKGADRAQIMNAYRRRPEVAYVEPNYMLHANSLPNDARFNELWGLHNTGQTGGTPGADIAVTGVWDVTTGSADVLVAVIDTGIDYNHPDLAANIWVNPAPTFGDVHGARWTNGDGSITSGDPMDGQGHGTHVAGTIGAVGNNSIGVVGVNWTVKMMGLKFLTDQGSGSTADAVSAIEYAVAKGVHLSCNSWGGGGYSLTLKNAIAAAEAAGQLFVAAAGNTTTDNDVLPHYPSSYTNANILAVASSDHNDLRSVFSCYGRTSVDLAAPGTDILSTTPGNSYATYSGTSMATPHVAGVAALLLSLHSDASYAQLKTWLMDGAVKKPAWHGFTVTEGRMSAAESFRLAALPTDILPVGNFTAVGVPEVGAVTLSWTLPSGADHVLIRRGTANRYPTDWNDGVEVYSGTATEFTEENLAIGQRCRYAAWVYYDGEYYSAARYAYARAGGDPDDYFTEFFAHGDNDLAYRSVYFVPDGSVNFYSAYSDTAAAFPSDPTGGTTLSLGLDEYQMVALSGGVSVGVFETVSSAFFVCANGYITFGQGDTTYITSLNEHFSLPRISGLFHDLDSTAGGTVSYRQFSDRVAVTYENVPTYNRLSELHSFQIEMFFDKRIRITWLQLGTSYGLAGLSDGYGLPPGFVNSDLSAYPTWPLRIIRLTGDLHFGQVLTGYSGQKTMTIHNDGNQPLTVSAITYPTGFSGNWAAGSVAAGGSRNVTVTFQPVQTANYGGQVSVQSDATEGTSKRSCSGEGIHIQVPANLSASSGTHTDRIALQWQAGLGALSYRIWRSTTPRFDHAVNIFETGDLTWDDRTARPGRTYYYWVASRRVQTLSAPGNMAAGWRRSRATGRNIGGDFDGDGRMDPAVYHEATGRWLIGLSGSGYATITAYLGGPGWRPVPGDYDGDGITDMAVYQPATGVWQALLSANGQVATGTLGGPGWRPVPGDYDGDGRTDPAVYHENSGIWQVMLSDSAYQTASLQLGGPGYVPAAADFDGDGRTDPAVFRLQEFQPGWSMGYWVARLSAQNYAASSGYFGDGGHIPVAADYNGDLRADPAIYRDSDGRWFISSPGSGPLAPGITLGGAGWIPVPGDYDGDGITDPVVYHMASGMWLARLSGSGHAVHTAVLGGPGYEPVVP